MLGGTGPLSPACSFFDPPPPPPPPLASISPSPSSLFRNVPLDRVVISSAAPPELGGAWPLPPPSEQRDFSALGLSPDGPGGLPLGGDTRDY